MDRPGIRFAQIPLAFPSGTVRPPFVSMGATLPHHTPNNKEDTGMKAALFFDSMLTPKIITIVYWLLLLAAVVGGFGSMFSGYGGFGIGSFFKGLFLIVAGAIGARIWCELLIVLFKMNEALQEIRLK